MQKIAILTSSFGHVFLEINFSVIGLIFPADVTYVRESVYKLNTFMREDDLNYTNYYSI